MKQLVYMRDSQKHLKFLCAALKCDTTKFQFYSEKKYDINGQNRVGFTALHHAVYVDSYRMVHALVWMPRINFNVQDLLGSVDISILHIAVRQILPNSCMKFFACGGTHIMGILCIC